MVIKSILSLKRFFGQAKFLDDARFSYASNQAVLLVILLKNRQFIISLNFFLKKSLRKVLFNSSYNSSHNSTGGKHLFQFYPLKSHFCYFCIDDDLIRTSCCNEFFFLPSFIKIKALLFFI